MKLETPLDILAQKNPTIRELYARLDLTPINNSAPKQTLISATINSVVRQVNSVTPYRTANRYFRPPGDRDGETESK